MAEPLLRIIYPHAGGRGWDTVTTLVTLASRLLGGEVTRFEGFPSAARKALSVAPRRTGGDDILLICPAPYALSFVLEFPELLRGHRRVVAWVIDSFWDDRIPRVARHRGHIDRLFVNDAEVVDSWSQQTGIETSALPFGADVLRHGTPGGDRPYDLQIVGRQPATWSAPDARSAAEAAGLRCAPAAPYLDNDPEGNQQGLRDSMSLSKFTLAFSNLAAPAAYTHPTRAYITGRWTEALAVGSVVAGIAPDCLAADRLFWPRATLELGTVERTPGLPILREAARGWTPELARHNYRMALERLDWRWRLRALADALGRPTPALDAELRELANLIAAEGQP